MRIAILSFYSGTNQRGVERWVKELSERLSKKYSVTVYQNKLLEKKTKYTSVPANIPFDNRNKSKNRLSSFIYLDYKSISVLRFIVKIIPILIHNKFDIIIPTDGGWESAIIRILTWINRKKMIIVGHAGIGWDDINNLWCFPDVFVALSSYAKAWARKINPFVKIECIPDAVDEKIFSPRGNKINVPLKKPIAICVSALEEGKRVDRIIKAVANMKDVSLLVCGKGELEEKLSEMGKRLLGNRFLLKSYSFDEMPSVYRSADIFISATKPFYSFEMVITEAMSCNLPIVANNDPIRAEIVGDAGILCDPENIKDFSDAISEALKKDWRDKPRKQAERFSGDKVIEKYEDLFKKLIEK